LLKIGRHFRFDKNSKFVVGRNKNENEMIHALALPKDVLFEAEDYVGPTSILRSTNPEIHFDFSTSITLRYSDAPNDKEGVVTILKNNNKTKVNAIAAKEDTYLQYRI